ncbi:RNA polymerase sigma-70 factor [Mucilaginibacter sp. BJC16-A38]|uniref:RNA polymerase sigma factor n=1 Tax=Mucilaginibacter phenanthrenivorans TaxID=1234842 RepID=UPI002158761F|nr:RNA polymerase sigma-70 factor [Mucilaginibacter phenanthrenivorans]MCR8559395.1 RNA polymerase sigma-70 factor [Mucilaginibacter phenanthrenivorans]
MEIYTNLPDNELIKLLQSGDHSAFKEIYERYIFILLNHAYNKTRNREEAKDLVHEVFTHLWAKHDAIDPAINLSGYLYTCVRNAFLNQVAKKEVQSRYLLSLEQFAAQGPVIADHRIRERQLMDLIHHEIESLSPKMREVFKLSRREYLSHREIAERLDISEQTVSKHVTNALKILHVKLGAFIYLAWFYIIF